MSIEPLPEISPPCPTGEDQLVEEESATIPEGVEPPGELSEFSQRLASFGLGESPDPLLTDARPSVTRRART